MIKEKEVKREKRGNEGGEESSISLEKSLKYVRCKIEQERNGR